MESRRIACKVGKSAECKAARRGVQKIDAFFVTRIHEFSFNGGTCKMVRVSLETTSGRIADNKDTNDSHYEVDTFLF